MGSWKYPDTKPQKKWPRNPTFLKRSAKTLACGGEKEDRPETVLFSIKLPVEASLRLQQSVRAPRPGVPDLGT